MRPQLVVNYTRPQSAELVVNSVDAVDSGSYRPGDQIQVNYEIRNTGGQTSNSLTVDFYASTDTTITTSDYRIGSATYSGLQAGWTFSGADICQFPPNSFNSTPIPSGDYYIGIIVACSNDSNPANNTGYDADPVTVSPPPSSGLAGVTVTLTGSAGTFTATTGGVHGLWQIDNVPLCTYTVTPAQGGWRFEHVVGGVSDGQASIQITVNETNRSTNQSIQFLAHEAPDKTIGGAVYTDLNNPLTSGLEGVTITVTGPGGPFSATTAGPQGLWQMDNIPVSTEPHTVAPSKDGWRFEHVVGGVSDGQASIQIMVNEANQGPNQSIQFLASRAFVIHDWSGDGILSIIGDVPPFVDCVYFDDCPNWSQERLLGVGDCNRDGIISIIGDVPCFVDCVYFGDCAQ
jgi:hypothetical protein